MAVINMLPSGGALSVKGLFMKEEHRIDSGSFTTAANYKKAFVIGQNGTTPTLSKYNLTSSVPPDFEIHKVYDGNTAYWYMYFEELPTGTQFTVDQNRGYSLVNIFTVAE